jgi:hypothetical protein
MADDVVNATTKQRHDEIFKVYCLVLKELGDQATNVTKKSLYESVAKKTGYSRERISKIITMKFREKNHAVRSGK